MQIGAVVHRPALARVGSVGMRARAGRARDAGRVSDGPPRDAGELLSVSCPRCGRPVDERFYGPCTSCRTELRATIGGEAHAVEVEAYEPKMNVTPNAVATKD